MQNGLETVSLAWIFTVKQLENLSTTDSTRTRDNVHITVRLNSCPLCPSPHSVPRSYLPIPSPPSRPLPSYPTTPSPLPYPSHFRNSTLPFCSSPLAPLALHYSDCACKWRLTFLTEFRQWDRYPHSTECITTSRMQEWQFLIMTFVFWSSCLL